MMITLHASFFKYADYIVKVSSLFIVFFLVLNESYGSNRLNIKLVDNANVVIDTIVPDFSNGQFVIVADIINSTKKRGESHNWLFSENVDVSIKDNGSTIIDDDLNSLRFKNKATDVELHIVPNFIEIPTFTIYTMLSKEIVYSAVLKYPILAVNFKNNLNNIILDQDTIISACLSNNGLSPLSAIIQIDSDIYHQKKSDTITIKPNSDITFDFYFNILPKQISNSDTLVFPVNINLINADYPKNRINKNFNIIIYPVAKVKNYHFAYVLLLLLFLTGVLYLLWYMLKQKRYTYGNKIESRKVFSINELFIELRKHKKNLGLDDWINILDKEGVINEIKGLVNSEKSAPKRKKEKVLSEFVRKDIIQRTTLERYISDDELHRRLKDRGEVELVKYVSQKFKDSLLLQRIIEVDASFTNLNIVGQVKKLSNNAKADQKPTKRTIIGSSLDKGFIENKVVNISRKSIASSPNYSEYLLLLENLQNLIKEIIAMDWEVSFEMTLLKNKFLGYLGIKEDRLANYIASVKNNQLLADGDMSDLELNRFLDLFTDLFNLQSFTHFPPFLTAFKKVLFPLNQYDNLIESLIVFWQKKWHLELIIPNIFTDNYNPTIHQDTDDVSKVLAENVIDIPENIAPGVVKDYSRIGLISKNLNLYIKAEVYIER